MSFRDEARFYEINGKRLPSVTTILGIIDKSGPLMGWAVKLEREAFKQAMLEVLTGPHGSDPQKVWDAVEETIKQKKAHIKELETAQDIGTGGHELIAWETRKMLGQDPGPRPIVPEGSELVFMSWQDWCKKVEFKPIKSEFVVSDPIVGYAGRCDVLANVEGVEMYVDYKSGKAIYNESKVQVVAYMICDSLYSASCGILRLPKTLEQVGQDPDWLPIPEEQVGLHYEAFKSALNLWRWKRKMEGKEI